MKITFLGTSSTAPTKERNTAAILLEYKGEYTLLDCGEGTQRQLKLAKISPARISKILISHWHGDHIFGIPGLLQTIGVMKKNATIEIYGPKKTKEHIKNMQKSFSPFSTIKIISHEITKESKIINTKDYEVNAKPVKHSTHCLAYSFKEKDKRKINLDYTKKFGLIKHPLLGKLQQGKTITYKGKKITPKQATIIKPGKKITYITDCKKTKDLVKFAVNSDLLISESTFSDELKKIATERLHLTAKQAAEIAKKAKAKKLIITHFSQRYKSTKHLEKETKAIFKNTIAAKDFMTVSI